MKTSLSLVGAAATPSQLAEILPLWRGEGPIEVYTEADVPRDPRVMRCAPPYRRQSLDGGLQARVVARTMVEGVLYGWVVLS